MVHSSNNKKPGTNDILDPLFLFSSTIVSFLVVFFFFNVSCKFFLKDTGEVKTNFQKWEKVTEPQSEENSPDQVNGASEKAEGMLGLPRIGDLQSSFRVFFFPR